MTANAKASPIAEAGLALCVDDETLGCRDVRVGAAEGGTWGLGSRCRAEKPSEGTSGGAIEVPAAEAGPPTHA